MSGELRSYAAPGQSTADDTLTSKALRVAAKSEALRARIYTIAQRVAPAPEKAMTADAPRPEPSHAVFALEVAERALDDAANLADNTLRAL